MFNYRHAFSSFSVDDIAKAKAFYTEVLGLKVDEAGDAVRIHLNDNTWIYVYPKSNHEPASFTVLNFDVADVEKTVRELKEKGVTFEHYPDTTDEDGISRGPKGPVIAWFKDPAGNVIAVMKPESNPDLAPLASK